MMDLSVDVPLIVLVTVIRLLVSLVPVSEVAGTENVKRIKYCY